MPAREIILAEVRTISKDDMAATAEGPFKAVKRLNRGNDLGPVLAKIDALQQKVGNFCLYQPQIGRFARQNPDNMGAAIVFVLASQGTAWHNLVEWFPMMMDHLRKQKSLFPYPENVPWKAMVYRGGRAIDQVWQNRQAVFRRVEKAKDDLEIFAALLTVPGLSLPKAGFAAQLIAGRYGCLDSVNQFVVGVPLDLMTVDNDNQPSFVSMKSFLRGNGELTPEGRRKMELYVQFLDSIKHSSTDSISQQLWDQWCEIVSGKIWHAAIPRGQLDVKIGRDRTLVPTYPDVRVSQQGEFRSHSPAANLDAQHKRMDKVTPEKRGALIGKQHRELVTGESKPKLSPNIMESTVTLHGPAGDRLAREIATSHLSTWTDGATGSGPYLPPDVEAEIITQLPVGIDPERWQATLVTADLRDREAVVLRITPR